MVAPILTTKLHIPSPRPNLVPRERLLERLDQGLHHKLTVISAPAGFGKTTLLAEWISSRRRDPSSPAVAWVSLDDGDNDPARFSAYLIAALQSLDKGVIGGNDSAESATPSLYEIQLVKLINRVAARSQDFLLVLDDYHLITSHIVHDAIVFLVDHLPENLRLCIATRADPPLPLPRLRARGELTELRQSDLRFSTDEAAAFLNDMLGLELSAKDLAALEHRTEGWIAGLQMAALSLQGQTADPAIRSEFIRNFTGSHRFVLDYLVEEVLQQQPPAVLDFLLKTSILERLSGPLCDAVLVSENTGTVGSAERIPVADSPVLASQSALEYLEATNLFIIPLDGERRWYRYHRLFADLLRQRLIRSMPDALPDLHRRASLWHEQRGLTAEAIEHSLSAGDFERASVLIEAGAESALMRSEMITFRNWVKRLPDKVVRGRPTLGFYWAWTLLMSGQPLEVVQAALGDLANLQDGAERSGAIGGRMAALRAYLALFQADLIRATELCHHALEHLPEGDRFLRSIVGWMLSLAHLSDGDLRQGKERLQELVRQGQEMGNPLIAVTALSHQAQLHKRGGRLGRARELLEKALRLATDAHGRRLPIASEPLMALGDLEREWNQLGAAAEHLTEGIELARQWSELASFDGHLPLMRTRLAQGDAAAARRALDTAQQIARRSEITQLDDRVADLQGALFFATQGDIVGAMQWAEKWGLLDLCDDPQPALDETSDNVSSHLRKYEFLVLARLLLLTGRAGTALQVLDALLVRAVRLARVDLRIEIQILRTLSWQAEGHQDQAMDALAEALSLAEPEGYRRIFLDEGKPMADLLRHAASRGLAPVYIATLLADMGESESPAKADRPVPDHHQPLFDPLSDREQEVLQLLAAGLSNPEIADELYIAVSTVRSHCKNIYSKLDVHNRWDAVQRGRELGLV
jgi:LuxR family maltose regulon positive regulatory protein